MARIAQPVELAKLKGAHKKNPQRYKKEPPKSAHPLGESPKHIRGKSKDSWDELCKYCLKGVLTGADRFILEISSNLLAEYRSDPQEFSAAKLEKLIGCLARLGMTPADRQKLGVEKKAEDESFDDF